jgi:hypothetical protein
MIASSAHILNFNLLAENTVRHRALMEERDFLTKPSKARESPEIIPAYQGYGAYYVDLYLGSPPQRQTVLVDTGSENIAIPCLGCQDCGNGHTDRPFDPSFSASFRKLNCSDCLRGKCSINGDTCEVGSSYVEGSSWSGFEVQDYVYAGGHHDQALDIYQDVNDNDDTFSGTDPKNAAKYLFPLKFTCMEKNEGEFKKQKADGIMGLNMKSASFWMQMWNTGTLVKKQFSICLRRYPFSSLLKQDRPVGIMTLGGTDARLNKSPMVFMDMAHHHRGRDGFYHVHISKIYLSPEGGQRLGGSEPDINFTNAILLEDDKSIMNKQGVVIDSGTTDTILAKDLKPAFDRAWQAITGTSFPDQYIDIPANQLKTWPTVIFQFKSSTSNNTLIAFPPSSYMSLDFSTGRYKPTLWFHDKYGTSILGSNFMRSHNVLFDIENRRIGMAESDCDYNELVTGEKSKFPDVYANAKEVKQLLQIEHMQSMCEDRGASCFLNQSIWTLTMFFSVALLCVASLEVYQHYKQTAVYATVDVVIKNKSFDCEQNEDLRPTLQL